MANLGEAYVEVRGKTDKFAKDVTDGVSKGLEKATDAADGFGKTVGDAFKNSKTSFESFTNKAVLPATAALGGAFALIKKTATAASDLAEEQSKAGQIFGDSSAQVEQFAKTAAASIGQSERQALAAASTFGIFGNAAGLSGQELVGFSTKFTTLASDLASFNNTTPEEAITAIGAALRGESEPIRRYGVLLDDASLRQQAFKMGLVDTVKDALTPQQRSLAASELILQQTSKAQGDFARTADGAANRQRTLAAEVANASTQIGQAFEPVLRVTLGLLTDFARVLSGNKEIVVAATIAIGGLAAGLLAANVALKAWRVISAITAGINYALATSFTAVQVATGVGIATVIAGAAAFAVVKDRFADARKEADKLKDSTDGLNGALGALNTYGLSEVQYALATFVGPLNAATAAERDNLAAVLESRIAAEKKRQEMARLAGQTSSTKNKVDELTRKVKELRDALGDDFAEAAKRARKGLEDAGEAFADFARNVQDAVTSSFSFRDAYEAGTESGGGFFAALTAQAQKARTFGELVNRLLAGGLSEAALQQVLAAGVDAGSAIAQEILGSADGIIRANTLAADVAAIGAQVGQNAAVTFRQAGVDAATALVAGVDSVLSQYRVKLKSKKLTPKQLRALQRQFAVDVEFTFSGGGAVPALANGGVVNRAQVAMIGEAGAEAVIPITRPARALQLMEQAGLADLVRGAQGAAVNIESATFVAPLDADLVAQKVLVAEKARAFAG